MERIRTGEEGETLPDGTKVGKKHMKCRKKNIYSRGWTMDDGHISRKDKLECMGGTKIKKMTRETPEVRSDKRISLGVQ